MDSSGEDVDNVRSKICVFLNYISIAFLLCCLRADLCVFSPSRGLPDLSLLKESVFCFVLFFISLLVFSSGENGIFITSALVGCRIAPSFSDGLGCGFTLQF